MSAGEFPIACAIMVVMYALMMVGRYAFFERLLAAFAFSLAVAYVGAKTLVERLGQ